MAKKTKEIVPTIKQANKLILAGQKITLQSKRLIYFMASHINEQSENPKIAMASWEDFLEFVQLREPKNWWGRKNILKNILKNLNDNPVEVETEQDGVQKFTIVNWVQSLTLNDDDTVQMVFADDLIPFLIYLKDQPYTRTIYEIGQFKSMYAVRLKEIIETERWKEQSHFDMSVEKLKWLLGVEEKYKLFADFRVKILEVAKKELAAKNSPVQFSYATINKKGRIVKRGVQAIRFFPKFIDVQTAEDFPEETNDIAGTLEEAVIIDKAAAENDKSQHADIYGQLRKWSMADALISQYIQAENIVIIRQAIEFVKTKKEVNNPAGLFIKTVANGWKSEETEQKEKKKTAARKATEAKKEAEKRKARERALRRSYHNKEKKICDELLNSHEGMLETAYNMAITLQQNKAGGHVILNRLPKDPQQLYESKMYKHHIIQQLREIFDDRFVELDNTFLPKIEALSGK